MLLTEAERVIASAGHDEMAAWAAFDSAIGFYEAMGMRAAGRKWDILGVVRGGNPMLMTKKTSAPGPSGFLPGRRPENGLVRPPRNHGIPASGVGGLSAAPDERAVSRNRLTATAASPCRVVSSRVFGGLVTQMIR